MRVYIRNLTGIGVPDEIWVDSNPAIPPLEKMVPIDPKRYTIEHSLETSAIERDFDCTVTHAGVTIDDGNVFGVSENRLA